MWVIASIILDRYIQVKVGHTKMQNLSPKTWKYENIHKKVIYINKHRKLPNFALLFRILVKKKQIPLFLIKVDSLSPATAPDDKVAIIGVFVLELIWARHLKSNPSSAIA